MEQLTPTRDFAAVGCNRGLALHETSQPVIYRHLMKHCRRAIHDPIRHKHCRHFTRHCRQDKKSLEFVICNADISWGVAGARYRLSFFQHTSGTLRGIAGTVTPDKCSARFMLDWDPKVGWVSWRSIWSCCQFSYNCTVMAMPRVWFGCSSLSAWHHLVKEGPPQCQVLARIAHFILASDVSLAPHRPYGLCFLMVCISYQPH